MSVAMPFHLRPVTEHPPSPSSSSSASTTTAAERSPPPKSHLSAHITSRRPLSPSSLRDVNLSQDANPVPRKYPAPPTGHELMALFPPAPPANFPEMRPGPTSGFFQRQERAFFAQAGKEIVRVRVEIDVPPQLSDDVQSHQSAKSRESSAHGGPPRTWPQLHPHPPHQSPTDVSTSPPGPYPHPKQPRQSHTIPAPTQSPAIFPGSPHGQPPQPPNLHTPASHQSGMPLRTPPHDSLPGTKVEFQAPEDYRDDTDEAWRRPTPYADRRRAGKHTRRVIVRN